ncbi:hypothetical protein [Streptomyces sp. NPDC015345]|uniref:hypothetical protein n=1 Tax=Streptomyces sp. NPDC015345 TaxID=3364953 RepID=UPI0036FED699
MGQRNSGAGKDLRSDEDAYRDAFDLFLAGTDQKTRTHAYLCQVIDRLPTRRLFLDGGRTGLHGSGARQELGERDGGKAEPPGARPRVRGAGAG